MIIRLKRASKSTWETKNPILQSGEPGIEKGENGKAARMKIGNGLADWNDLPYATVAPDEIENFINTYLANFDWSSLNLGNEKYSTTKPTEITVGGVPVGTSFTNASIKKVFDMMFYGDSSSPVPPSLTPITTTPTVPSLHVGDTFNLTKLSTTVTKGENSIATIVLKKNDVVVQTISNKPDGGLIEFTLSESLTATTKYTIEVSDGVLPIASRSISITFEAIAYKAPVISTFTGTPSNGGTKTEPTLITSLSATVTAGSEPITKVEFFQDDVVIHTISSPTNGGTYSFVPNITISKNTVFKVVVTDSHGTVNKTYGYNVSIASTVKIYWGCGADEIWPASDNPFTEAQLITYFKNEANIKLGSSKSVTTQSNQLLAFSSSWHGHPDFDGAHLFYAYPKDWGLLPPNDDENTVGILTTMNFKQSYLFHITETIVDDMEYYVYYTYGYKDPPPGFSLKFNFVK